MMMMESGHNMSGSHAGHTMSPMNMSHMHAGHTMSPMNMSHMHAGHGDMGDMHKGGMGGMSGMDMPGMNMDMKMYFHTGISEYVLFKDCHTSSSGGMIGACFIIFVAAILYEGLKFLREVLLQKSIREQPRMVYSDKDIQSDTSVNSGQCSNVGSRMFSSSHFLQTFLHIVQVFVSYCLMLIFMTYNIWLCLAVVLGAGCGYFLFGWKRAVIVDSNEHCH